MGKETAQAIRTETAQVTLQAIRTEKVQATLQAVQKETGKARVLQMVFLFQADWDHLLLPARQQVLPLSREAGLPPAGWSHHGDGSNPSAPY